MATPGGFEPPISTVTGWHVSPLHHGAIPVNMIFNSYKAAMNRSFTNKSLSRDDILCQGRLPVWVDRIWIVRSDVNSGHQIFHAASSPA